MAPGFGKATADLLGAVDLERTLFNVVSKSGDTVETMARFLIVRDRLMREFGAVDYKDHVIVTTEAERGSLRQIVNDEGFKALAVPPDIDGRFSALTAVGLFPAAVAGIDVEELLVDPVVPVLPDPELLAVLLDDCPTTPLTSATVPRAGARSRVLASVTLAWSTVTWALVTCAFAASIDPWRGAWALTATPARVEARLARAAASELLRDSMFWLSWSSTALRVFCAVRKPVVADCRLVLAVSSACLFASDGSVLYCAWALCWADVAAESWLCAAATAWSCCEESSR